MPGANSGHRMHVLLLNPDVAAAGAFSLARVLIDHNLSVKAVLCLWRSSDDRTRVRPEDGPPTFGAVLLPATEYGGSVSSRTWVLQKAGFDAFS